MRMVHPCRMMIVLAMLISHHVLLRSCQVLAWQPSMATKQRSYRTNLSLLRQQIRPHPYVDNAKEEGEGEQAQQFPTRKSFSPGPQFFTTVMHSILSALLVFQMTVASVSPAFAIMDIPTDPSEYRRTNQNLPVGQKYWSIMNEGGSEVKVQANKALMDYVVGTINTHYYDNTGGAYFSPRDFYSTWRSWFDTSGPQQLTTRQGVVEGLSWLTQQLPDPFSKYLTREDLLQELHAGSQGFLGLGAMVEPAAEETFFGALRTPVLSEIPPFISLKNKGSSSSSSSTGTLPLLSATEVSSLPILTAVGPNSPAEHTGLTVGDRIVAVQRDSFLGMSSEAIKSRLQTRYQAENYLGRVDLTIAKPVYATVGTFGGDTRNVIVAYRPQHIRLTTTASSTSSNPETTGILQYQLLTSGSPSPFRSTDKVGYIRLTRFSKAGTSAFLQAVQELESEGASAYILDLRNNYGGVIQEAMLTASSLLRDPHSILCYTLNSRGGFTPHAVEEFVVDRRYPGYLLSKESKFATLQQVKKESPQFLHGEGWSPPSSYASLHEQMVKRQYNTRPPLQYVGQEDSVSRHRKAAQKPMVVLINEGTASSAEVFVSALHDNGRTTLVGTKTYGKGLIQHTFPLPDGGGLRLTVAEYLTPGLKHVTQVGNAQFDQGTGEWVGGGIKPDVLCDSTQGIPSDVGGDLCVGVGLDVLSETRTEAKTFRMGQNFARHSDEHRTLLQAKQIAVGK